MADDTEIDKFYTSLSLRKLRAAAVVRMRAGVYVVTIRHSVGYGGSRDWHIRNAASKNAAVEAIYAHLHKQTETTNA